MSADRIDLEELEESREKARIDKVDLFDFYDTYWDSVIAELKHLRAKLDFNPFESI